MIGLKNVKYRKLKLPQNYFRKFNTARAV